MKIQELKMRFEAEEARLLHHEEMILNPDEKTKFAIKDALEETRAILDLINAHIQMDEL